MNVETKQTPQHYHSRAELALNAAALATQAMTNIVSTAPEELPLDGADCSGDFFAD